MVDGWSTSPRRQQFGAVRAARPIRGDSRHFDAGVCARRRASQLLCRIMSPLRRLRLLSAHRRFGSGARIPAACERPDLRVSSGARWPHGGPKWPRSCRPRHPRRRGRRQPVGALPAPCSVRLLSQLSGPSGPVRGRATPRSCPTSTSPPHPHSDSLPTRLLLRSDFGSASLSARRSRWSSLATVAIKATDTPARVRRAVATASCPVQVSKPKGSPEPGSRPPCGGPREQSLTRSVGTTSDRIATVSRSSRERCPPARSRGRRPGSSCPRGTRCARSRSRTGPRTRGRTGRCAGR
jgi:hypothetical protein